MSGVRSSAGPTEGDALPHIGDADVLCVGDRKGYFEEPCRPLLLGMGWSPPQHGGLNRYLRCLHEALEASGEQPAAIVLGPATNAPPSVDVASHYAEPLWRRLAALTCSLWRATPQANVIDAHFALYALPSMFLPRARRLPFVVHFQGPWSRESALTGDRRAMVRAKRLVERAVYSHAEVLIVLSPAFKDILIQQYGIPNWRIRVLPPGVDLRVFCPGSQEVARGRLGISSTAWVVVAVRRLVPRMGIDVLLQAWSQLRSGRPDAELIIIGSGPDRRALQLQADEAGFGDSVRFLGDISDTELTDAYRASDMSVVPTLSLEGFGLVTLESMACGTPVVVTAVDGLTEIPARLDPTTVVPPGDVDALARRMSGAANGSSSLPSSAECREVAEGFSWQSVAQRHADLYRELARPGRTRKLRVAYVDHVAQLSGGELALLRLIPALADVEAHVILAEDGPLNTYLKRAGISTEVLPMSGAVRDARRASLKVRSMPRHVFVTLAYALRLAIRLRALKPDLVHTNSLKAALYGGVAARLAGAPVVWHVRDRIAPDYLPKVALHLVHLLAGALPQAIIANSATTLATVAHRAKNAQAIPDLVEIPPTDASRGGRPDRLNRFTVGMVGRLAPWKGQDVFLRAFAATFGGTDARAVLVGGALFDEEPYERSLHELVARLGVSRQVEFSGHCDDVFDKLDQFDVLVHASVIPEPFGQVVLEGMAAGLPVVATDAGGPAEVIHHGIDGLLVPPGDVHSMALTLATLAADPDLRTVLGRNARRVARGYTREFIAPQVMALYQLTLRSLSSSKPSR